MSKGLLVNLVLMAGVAVFAFLTSFNPFAAVTLGIGLALAALALRWPDQIPKLGLYAIVALVPLSAIGGRLPFPLVNSLTKGIFLAAFGGLLAGLVFSNRRLLIGSQGKAALLFGGAAVLSYLANAKTADSLPGLMRLLNHVLLLLLAINVLKTGRDLAILLGLIVATCLLSALGGLLMPIQWGVGYGTAGTRLSGWTIQADAPTFGLFLLLSVLICFYFLLTARRMRVRLALATVAGLLTVAIVSTYARSAFLVLVMTVAFTLFKLRKRVSMPLALLGLLVIALIAAPRIPEAFQTRLKSLVTRNGPDPTVQWRLDSARIGWDLFARQPLVGRGPGNFPAEYMAEEFRYDRPVRPGSVIGNTVVSLAYQTGLIGLGCFALLIGVTWRDLAFVRRSYPPAGASNLAGRDGTESHDFLEQMAGILEILLVALLMFSLLGAIEKEKYLWIVLAAAAVAARLRRDELRAPLPAALPEPG